MAIIITPYLLGLIVKIKRSRTCKVRKHSINISSHCYYFLKDSNFDRIPKYSIQATKYSYRWEENRAKTDVTFSIVLRLWATVHSEEVECASLELVSGAKLPVFKSHVFHLLATAKWCMHLPKLLSLPSGQTTQLWFLVSRTCSYGPITELWPVVSGQKWYGCPYLTHKNFPLQSCSLSH